MEDLALHILDIVQNSIRAKAQWIEIDIHEDISADLLQIRISDNGNGMDATRLQQVANPFFTTRTTRKVGLGISLLKANAEQCGGNLHIESLPGKGTRLMADFRHAHIDRPPMGDIPGVVVLLMAANPSIHFMYRHTVNQNTFELDSNLVQNELGEVPITEAAVQRFLREMIIENLEQL